MKITLTTETFKQFAYSAYGENIHYGFEIALEEAMKENNLKLPSKVELIKIANDNFIKINKSKSKMSIFVRILEKMISYSNLSSNYYSEKADSISDTFQDLNLKTRLYFVKDIRENGLKTLFSDEDLKTLDSAMLDYFNNMKITDISTKYNLKG